MLIARGEGWLVKQSVEDDLGVPTKIDNASMSGDEVIIHHSHARCGRTWRMGSGSWEYTGNTMTGRIAKSHG
jgi:hypothetical protein